VSKYRRGELHLEATGARLLNGTTALPRPLSWWGLNQSINQFNSNLAAREPDSK